MHTIFFGHVVIIEVDENRHSGYSCENIRTMEIFQDIGCRPCVFIRFNPDSYTTSNGKKIKSPLAVKRDTGKLELTNKKDFDCRLSVLKDTFKKYGSTLIQLYYKKVDVDDQLGVNVGV